MKDILIYCLLFCFTFRLAAQVQGDEESIPAVLQKTGFIENKSQINDQDGNPNTEAVYILPTLGNTVVLKAHGFSYDTYVDEYTSEVGSSDELILPTQEMPAAFTRHYHRVDIVFEGCNEEIEIEKDMPLAGVLNFYTPGTVQNGILDVRSYSRIVYKNVYPNIDIEFLAFDNGESQFEYNFILHPGADINAISLLYSGMNDVNLQDGALIFNVAHGQFREHIPLSFRHDDYTPLEIGYNLRSVQHFNAQTGEPTANNLNQTSHCKAQVGFAGDVGVISSGITIDPTPYLLWATYYGGPGSDYGYGITKDLNGFVLVCGSTTSNSLIATAGAQQSTIASSGVQDSFVLKMDELGIRQWCTYYGGTGLDYGRSLVCDLTGNVYVAGDSESSSGISTVGSHQSVFGGIRDSYLLKLNATGVRQWSTYYGGSAQEFVGDICLDITGNLIFVGNSGSTNSIATAGAFQTANGGQTDGFIIKFNTSGTRIWGTFVGGVLTDAINAAAIDLANNIYVVGNTVSTNAISTPGAFQTAALGNNDAFVMKFNTGGGRLWGTYYGGSGNDIGSGIVCDISDFPCVCGYTQSTTGLSTTGAHQVVFGGGSYDGFVVRFNTTGARQWATFLGGSLDDLLWNIAADDCGNMYTTGQTQSTSGLTTADTHQGSHGGLSDLYVSKFEEMGNIIWSTYYGGAGQDYGRSLCLDQGLNIYVTGQTASAGMSTAGAQQPNLGGGADALVFKFYTYSALPIELISFDAIPLSAQSVLTTWETSSELNNAFFTVERSIDGFHFETAGILQGAGTSQFYRSYQLEDTKPYNGISYYRLKQTDFNGQFSYSNLAVVHFDGDVVFEVYPNPSKGIFKLVSPEDSFIDVFSISGTHITTIKVIKGINELNLSSLPEGMYACRLSGTTGASVTKLVIEK